MKRKLLVILSCFPSCCFPELWYPSPVVLTSPCKAAKLCPFSWPNLRNTRVHKKLPVPKVSSFALGQLSFENKSLYNVERRGAAHISVDHKLQLRSRNVYKNAILNSAFIKNHVHPVIWDMKLRQQFNLKSYFPFWAWNDNHKCTLWAATYAQQNATISSVYVGQRSLDTHSFVLLFWLLSG